MKKFKFQGEEWEVDDEYEWVTADSGGIWCFVTKPEQSDGNGIFAEKCPLYKEPIQLSIGYFEPTLSKISDLLVNKPKDMVKEPEHYMTPCGLNVQRIYRHLPFFRGNSMKYIFRAGKKYPDKEIEDLKKAITCLEFEIKRLEEK